MASEATLKLLLLGEDRSAGKTLKGVGREAETTRGKFGKLASTSGKLLAGGLLAAGAAAVKFGQAAADDELAATRLATSLKNSAGATDAQVAASEDWITALGKQTGITDDELRPALGRLAIATGDVGAAQDLTRLAMDISAGSGKSLKAVTEGLAKAQNGNVAGLARLGIATKDADGKTKSLEQITADLAKTYEGQAAKAAETTAGKQKILTTQMAELGEELGTKTQPLLIAVANAGLKVVDWIGKNQQVVKVLVVAFASLAAIIIATNVALKVHAAALVIATAAKKIHVFWTNAERLAKIKSTAQMVLNTAAMVAAAAAGKIVAAGLKVMAAAQWLMNAALAANPIGLVVIALVALGVAMVALWKKSETFRTIVKGALKGIGDAGKWLWDNALRPAFASIVKVWTTVVGALINGAAKAFGWVPGIGGKLKTAADEFNTFADKANAALDGIDDETVNVNVRLNQTKGVLTPLAQNQALLGARAVGGPVNTAGWYRINENGTEDIQLPTGSRVYSANQTDQMRSGGTGARPTIVEVNFNGVVGDKREAARMILGVLKEHGTTTGAPVTV